MPLIKFFQTLSPIRQLVALATLFVVLCVVGGLIYVNFLRAPYSILFANLRLSDAATVVADLDKKKIPYQLTEGGATVLVPTKLADATRLDEMSEELPIKGQVGFELFNKSDMGLTDFAEKINYQRALQGELARTIMTLDSVEAARVHLSLPDPSIFRDDRRPPKASATLVARPGKMISLAAVAGIRRLIAAAVPDLDPGSVVILDQRGNVVGDQGPLDARAGLTPLGAALVPASPPDPNGNGPTTMQPALTKGDSGAATVSKVLVALGEVLVLVLVFLVGYLVRRRSDSPHLSAQERAIYVDRFRSLLSMEGADG